MNRTRKRRSFDERCPNGQVRRLTDRRAPRGGQTVTEYALVLMLIALVAIGIVFAVGGKTESSFEGVAETVNNAGSSGGASENPSTDVDGATVTLRDVRGGTGSSQMYDVVSYGPAE